MNTKAVILDYSYLGGLELFALEKAAAEKNGIALEMHTCKTEDDIIACASDARVVMACGNPPLTARVIQSLKSCKGIIRYGIGVNSVNLDAATLAGIPVYNMPGFCNEELVMHATALLLCGLRNITWYDSQIRLGNFPKAKGPMPRRLSRMTIGLLGFGASAKGFAVVCSRGFGARVIAYDPFLPKEVFEKEGCQRVSLDEVLTQSDVVSLHLPLTEDTRHIINQDSLSRMKDGVIIINIARGGLINQTDLVAALQNGKVRFAGLDVHEKEPLPAGAPLASLENVILTPHSAFYGQEALETQHKTAADLMIRVMAGEKRILTNLANRDLAEKE